MTELQPAPQETPETALHRGRLGILGIVFFVVAAAAPLVGMTGAVPVAIVLGNGAAAPGAYVVVGIILLLFSVGYAAMATKVTNVGAFFAFVGRGLGIIPGVGSAFVSLVAYLAVQLAVFGFFGGVVTGQMADSFGIEWKWWVWTLIAWAVVTGLSALSVDIGAKVLGVLMGIELLSLVVTAFAVLLSSDKPEGIDLGASFSFANIFSGGLSSTAGIALAFAFASYIGFEATAIYGEESKDPHRTVPRATYLAVITITVIFGFTAFAIVTGLGASTVIDRTVELSTVDKVPLANPANVLFSVADTYVGGWMKELMSWLVISSLFAGLLAFQNSAARYFYAMGRAGVLPQSLDRVNGRGAPWTATVVTSVISLAVIATFAITGRDPVLNLFYWFSGLAVIAIVFVEILVSVAVIAFFSRHRGEASVWASVFAPLLSIGGLLVGLWLLMSRFALLAGTVKDGVDPTTQPWGLNATGWTLVLAPFVLFVVGTIVGKLRLSEENEDAVADLVT
ncbi:APC family permease [Nocardioides sp.]|uniref:APC family permease n=1 Tax=Nocardioides sp. TaxID=35761 RepID=UPI0037840383